MKAFKILWSLALLALATQLSAQSPDYIAVMTERTASIDSLPLAQYAQEASEYERYASLEGSDWLASYYAAYCKTIIAISKPSEADLLSLEVETLLVQAEQAGGDASEIACIRSLMATARLMLAPQERYMTEGAEAMKQIEIALEHNPNNPRAYLLKGQSVFYTPAQFGGGRERAIPLLRRCLELQQAQTPIPAYAPRWGAARAAQLLGDKL